MAQVRARWSATWTPPRGVSATHSFRLVMTDTAGEEFSLERATTDALGETSHILVTELHLDDTDARAFAAVGLTESVLAGMLKSLVGRG